MKAFRLVRLAPKTGPRVKVYNGASYRAREGIGRWSGNGDATRRSVPNMKLYSLLRFRKKRIRPTSSGETRPFLSRKPLASKDSFSWPERLIGLLHLRVACSGSLRHLAASLRCLGLSSRLAAKTVGRNMGNHVWASPVLGRSCRCQFWRLPALAPRYAHHKISVFASHNI